MRARSGLLIGLCLLALPSMAPGTATAAADKRPVQSFRSAPDLHPPTVTVTSGPGRAGGDIFVTPQNSPQVGPMILDDTGQVVWFDPLKNGSSTYYATNLEVQRYQGRPVLTWWQGEQFTKGTDVIMDRTYRTVAVVHAGNGYQADLHEFQLTPQGTALIDATNIAHADLTSVGGPRDGAVLDYVIQEIDVRTGRVLWQWHALGHIPVDASYQAYSAKELWYDYFHLNSIQQLPDGNLIVSGRNTWAVYEISRKTGRVVWTLGGKDSNFRMGQGTRFRWQHDARLHPGGVLSVFDDGSGGTPQSERQSSAKLLRLDMTDDQVSLVHRFTHSPPLLTSASGSAELLPGGDVFVGWGQLPDFSEYTPAGLQIFNAVFPLGVGSYRALCSPWVARPRTRPSLAVSRSSSQNVKLYASWNGATQVRRWRVLGGSKPGQLKPLGISAPRSGFETAIRVKAGPRYLSVQALGGSGHVLGTSAAARVSG